MYKFFCPKSFDYLIRVYEAFFSVYFKMYFVMLFFSYTQAEAKVGTSSYGVCFIDTSIGTFHVSRLFYGHFYWNFSCKRIILMNTSVRNFHVSGLFYEHFCWNFLCKWIILMDTSFGTFHVSVLLC